MNSVRVEVDVYSGRPNPSWDLSAEDVQAFFQRIDALPLAPQRSGSSFPEGNLGYRGLKVQATKEDFVAHIEISRGHVVVDSTGSAPKRRLFDPGRSLERWLLQTGRERLDTDLLHYLRLEMEDNSAAP
jgi:hypothetical protein